MGRHSKGRHRAPRAWRMPSFRIRRSASLHILRQVDFPEPEGATPEWGDTLRNIRAVLKPVPAPSQLTPLSPIDLDNTAHLDPPTHYRRLAGP